MGIPLSKLQSESTLDVIIPGEFQNLENYNKILCYTSNSKVFGRKKLKTKFTFTNLQYGSYQYQRSSSENYRENPEKCFKNLVSECLCRRRIKEAQKSRCTKCDDIEYSLEHCKSLDQAAMKAYRAKKKYVFQRLHEWENMKVDCENIKDISKNKSLNVLFDATKKK